MHEITPEPSFEQHPSKSTREPSAVQVTTTHGQLEGLLRTGPEQPTVGFEDGTHDKAGNPLGEPFRDGAGKLGVRLYDGTIAPVPEEPAYKERREDY